MAGVSSKGHIHRLRINDLVLEVVVLAAAKQRSISDLSRLQKAMSQRGAASASKEVHHPTSGQAAEDHASTSEQRLHVGMLA